MKLLAKSRHYVPAAPYRRRIRDLRGREFARHTVLDEWAPARLGPAWSGRRHLERRRSGEAMLLTQEIVMARPRKSKRRPRVLPAAARLGITVVMLPAAKLRRANAPPGQQHVNRKKEARRLACRANKGRRREPFRAIWYGCARPSGWRRPRRPLGRFQRRPNGHGAVTHAAWRAEMPFEPCG